VITRLVRGLPSVGTEASMMDSPRRFDAPIFGLASAVALILGCISAAALIVMIVFTFFSGAPSIDFTEVATPMVVGIALWLWMCVLLAFSDVPLSRWGSLLHPVRSRLPRTLAAITGLASALLLATRLRSDVLRRFGGRSLIVSTTPLNTATFSATRRT